MDFSSWELKAGFSEIRSPFLETSVKPICKRTGLALALPLEQAEPALKERPPRSNIARAISEVRGFK